MYVTNFKTPWGIGLLYWDEAGIHRLELPGRRLTGLPGQDIETKNEPFDAVRQIRYYFEKKLKYFQLPLIYSGTAFQERVWQGLQQIPYGKKWSYAQLAEFIGHPRAVRAVGNANHANPLPLLIPCHRVVKSDGSLGGYGYGVAIKHDLLDLEKGR